VHAYCAIFLAPIFDGIVPWKLRARLE